MKYFALFDKQTKSYLLTGFNSTSIEDLIDAFVDFEEDLDFSDMTNEEIIKYIQQDYIIVEENKPIEG